MKEVFNPKDNGPPATSTVIAGFDRSSPDPIFRPPLSYAVSQEQPNHCRPGPLL